MRQQLAGHGAEALVGTLIATEGIGGGFLIWHTSRLPTGAATEGTALPSVLTFFGVLATASVTLIGLLLRQSLDKRTNRLTEAQEQRATVEQRRLQMQTAVEIVKLLGLPDASPAS